MLNWAQIAGPWLMAAVCGALLAWWTLQRRRRGRRGRGAVTGAGTLGKEWRELEPLVTQAFRLQGYQIIDSARDRPRADGELALRHDRETFLVQCREWHAGKVGAEVVHSLQRAMSAQGAAGGFVLTTGRFAREAVAYAGGCNVRLIDGPALRVLIEKARASRAAAR